MGNFRKPNQEEWGVLIAIVATIFGGVVRIYPVMIVGFPINDGGLFSVMIEAIKANGLRLPSYFHYNNLNIPFAYPPLAFYVGAVLSTFFHLRSVDIVQWMPGIILVGTLPAFYFLARAVLTSAYQAGLATLIFAFTPRTFTWLVMGGGLTRSYGMLFLLLALGFIYRLFKERNRKFIIGAILFSSLVILAHPEATLHTITFGLLIWLFKGRDKQGMENSLLLALGTIIVTSLWWVPTIIHIGLNPFLAASQTGSQTLLSVIYPFLLTLTDEPLLTYVAVLGLIGFFVSLVNKNYILPIWYFIPYLVDPRSAATYSMIPLSMMAGLALSEVILPFLARMENTKKATIRDDPFRSPVAISFLIISGLYMLGGTIYFGAQLAGSTLSSADRTAFNWIKTSTPAGSRFLVMTGESQILCDSVQEWFPVLTRDVNITTIQGNEWLPDKKYAQSVAIQTGVQGCMDGSSPLDCINQYHLQYDYIYINRQGFLKNFCRIVTPVSRGAELINTLKENAQYRLAYQSTAITIFAAPH